MLILLLRIKNNIVRNIIKSILLLSFYTVIVCALLINHIGDVFIEYITNNIRLNVSVIGDINDASMWRWDNYNPVVAYEKTKEYYNYINSIDDNLYVYSECTFDVGYISNTGYINGKLISEYQYVNETNEFSEEIELFKERQSRNFNGLSQNLLTTKVINSTEFYDLREGNVEIIEGRSFTKEEIQNGDNVCIVNSKALYIEDNKGEITAHYVHPGDKIKCSIVCFYNDDKVHETFELTVVGVYKPTNDFIHYRNTYLPLEFYTIIMDKMAEYEYQGINLNTVPGVAYYEVSSINQLKELINVIKDNEYGYRVQTNVNQIVDALSSCIAIADNIKGISSISFVTCMLFCIALIVLDVYYRKKEIGLLMSFGEERKIIVKQIILEEVMLYVVASIFAFILSKVLSGMIVNYLLNNNASHDILVYGGHQVKAAAMNIDLVLSSLDYVIYAAYILLLIVMNVLIVNNQVRKYSPKELLAGE